MIYICSLQILEQVKYRVEWAKYQERERQKEEELKERERSKCPLESNHGTK